MSALSIIGKRIDVFDSSLDSHRSELCKYQSDENITRDVIDKLLSILKSIETDAVSLESVLKLEIDKLVLKVDQKDPITGASRYGDASKNKILGYVARVDGLVPQYTRLLSEFAEFIKVTERKAVENGVDLSAPEVVVDEKLSRMQAPALGPIRNIDRYVEFQNVSEQQEDLSSKDISPERLELEEKARQVRERKAQEAERVKVVQEALLSQLEAYTSYFNSIRDFQLKRAALKDVNNPLSAPILLLRSNDKGVTQEALSTVLGILERIISRPDDIAARKLRITHPVLKAKLTGVLGGVELLMALGFQARVQKLETPADPKVPPAPLSVLEQTLALHRNRAFLALESTDATTTVFDSAHAVNHAASVFELLSPVTLHDIHLEMQEPSLDSLTSSTAQGSGKTDKLSWLDWFDSLSSYKNSIEQELINS